MMTDLDIIRTILKNPPPPPSPHDLTIQTQIDKIISFIEQEKIVEASAIIEKIFTKDFLDIRLVAYYAYAHFFNNGIKSFPESFPLLIAIVKEHWDKIKPLNRKDKQVQNSLNWLVLHLINKLKQLEKLFKKGEMHPLWTLSTVDITQDELDQIIKSVSDFKEFFHSMWPQAPTNDRLLHLLQMLNEINNMIKIEEPPIEEQTSPEGNVNTQESEGVIGEPPTEEQTQDASDASAPPSEGFPSQFSEDESLHSLEEVFQNASQTIFERSSPHGEAAGLSPEFSTDTAVLVENTPHASTRTEDMLIASEKMHLILEKLKVFELLIKANEYAKAALVAKDIDHLIENFDPLIYFPKLFSNHFALVARNIAPLSEQWENGPSLQSKYLEKLYQTDLDHFIKW